MMIYEIENFRKFDSCLDWQIWKFANFRNFKIWDIFAIVKFGKINKLPEFFQFEKPKFGSKNWQIL